MGRAESVVTEWGVRTPAVIWIADDREEDARKLGPRLQKLPIANVLSSPLQRAKRTCELAGFAVDQMSVPVKCDRLWFSYPVRWMNASLP